MKLLADRLGAGRKVVIKTVNQFAGVRCLHCDVLPDGATRERARQHVQNTGHTVRYVTENITIYEPSTGSIPRRQEC